MKPATLHHYLASHINHDPELRYICSTIPWLSIVSRKALLTICQTAYDCGDKPEIDRDLNRIDVDLLNYPELFPTGSAVRIVTRLREDHTTRSFISMLLRNEPFLNTDGIQEMVVEGGFIKEFKAGQVRKEEESGISYQCMDLDNYHPADYTIYYPMTPSWNKRAKGFIHRFANQIERLSRSIIYPKVQRKKNMSQETCRNLVDAGFKTTNWRNLRTLDLELFKMETGIRVKGEAEMRMVWRFNDLKPRCYYAGGGTNYWNARHVKPFAIAMMESIDSTQIQRRLHPEDIQYYLEEDDYLVMWDFSSFTTSLAELRHFLYYVIRNLEEDVRVRQHKIKCLDYQLGIEEITVSELLERYNEAENYGASYTIFRICESVFDSSMVGDEAFRQQNSGMLGVPGNIGFSTGNHGFHMEAGIREKTGSAVGDDAMGGTKEHPKERFIPHMQLLGDIVPEKAGILEPVYEGDQEQFGKFLKRRFTRTQYGLSIDYLFSFPSLAGVFGVVDEFHAPNQDSADEIILKFSGQVGAFFWDIHAIGTLEPYEIQLIDRVLGACYRKLRLPFHGSLPGKKHPAFAEFIPVAVPPLFFDYGNHDWAEYLWDHSSQRTVLLPATYGFLEIPPFEADLEFNATAGNMLNVLEDVGCVKKIRMLMELVEVSETNRRRFRMFLSGQRSTYRCRFTMFHPEWFDEIYGDRFHRSASGVVADWFC